MGKSEYRYYVVAECKYSKTRLAESKLMKLISVWSMFATICLELFFEMEPDVDFDQINFRIMRTGEEKYRPDQNVNLIKDFDKLVLNMLSNQERKNVLLENELIELHNVFRQIKTLINNHVLLNKFQNKERIKFISDKIKGFFNELHFLLETDFSELWSDFVYSLLVLYSFCEIGEYYESQFNLNHLIKLNYEGDIVQAKDEFLKSIR
jgi:hypothetical protein